MTNRVRACSTKLGSTVGEQTLSLRCVGGDPLGGISEGQGVQEDGSGDVGMDRELAGEILQVELLGGGLLILLDGGDVGLEGRRILALAQPGRDLVADRAEGGVDVVGVDGQRVGRLVSPEDVDRPGQQTEHAPRPLERAQRRQLLGQDRERLRVQRVAPAEQVSDLGTKHRRRQVDLVAVPYVGVGGNHRIGGGSVDLVEETTTEDVGRLVFFGGVELGGLAGSDHLGFGQRGQGPFVFLAVGVLGLGVLADGQGEHQGDVGSGLDRLEQGVEEGRELAAGPGISPFHLPQVDRDLVDHDQGGLAAEQLPDGLGPRGDVPLVALLDPSIAFGPGQTVGQLAPEGLGPEAALERQPVGRVAVLAVQGSHPDRSLRQQGRIDEFLDPLDPGHPPDGMDQGRSSRESCRRRTGYPGG